VVHVAALLLEGEVVDALPLLRGAERERREDLRLAAREQAGAVCARVDADLDLDRPDLLRAATVWAGYCTSINAQPESGASARVSADQNA